MSSVGAVLTGLRIIIQISPSLRTSIKDVQTKELMVSLIRLLPAWFHAIADYAVGATLIIVAVAAGGPGKVVGTGVVVGATVLAVSMLTRYPLGVVKILPFTIHSAGDYLAAALLVVAPFALSFNSSNTAMSVFYIVAGAAVLAVSLITNYQYNPKREWAPAKARPIAA